MKIQFKKKVEADIVLHINERELRALQALAGYGADNFLNVFYEHLGKHYLEPYEADLKSLFETLYSNETNIILSNLDDARESLGLVL